MTHAYHRQIEYGQELIIELTYNTYTPGYQDTFSCGVYYNCTVRLIPYRELLRYIPEFLDLDLQSIFFSIKACT